MQSMFKSFTDSFVKPKKKYSFENLKYLHQQLVRHPVIDERNQVLIVETLRLIAEILIWGDQHEPRFFDFFFEKNIHSYFLKILEQKTSPSIKVQLLQTLSILFENTKTETSIYYLLSNNYVNQIICHRFDFSNEEIMAYYVSFLKTLSLKLNKNTIHFFFNEHLNDFPLYTEAIKFFNHEESMIRIAVRTLTLNVYKVENEKMLVFILDRTAVPYFSNLVWFIGNKSVVLDDKILTMQSVMNRGKLEDLVAEHYDNLYYLNDIFMLNVHSINEVLEAQILKKFVVPLYIHSLVPEKNDFEGSRLSPLVSLYLLAQVVSVFSHPTLINIMVAVLAGSTGAAYHSLLEEFKTEGSETKIAFEPGAVVPGDSKNHFREAILDYLNAKDTDLLALPALCLLIMITKNKTIDRNLALQCGLGTRVVADSKAIIDSLTNGLSETDLKDDTNGQQEGSPVKENPPCQQDMSNDDGYQDTFVDSILDTVLTNFANCRPITVSVAASLMQNLVYSAGKPCLKARHQAKLDNLEQTARSILQPYLDLSPDIFLEIFENETQLDKPINIEKIIMDSSILFVPSQTPLTGIDFSLRLPCGDAEKSRKAIRDFLVLRRLNLKLKNQVDDLIPLVQPTVPIIVHDVLDLQNSTAIIECTAIETSGFHLHRFLIFDDYRLILVEPEVTRVGFGIVRLVASIEHVMTEPDKKDGLILDVVAKITGSTGKLVNWQAKLVFADHVRCMAASKHLESCRTNLRNAKMKRLRAMLDP